MALEQPWAITGPEITAATARQIAYQATGGNSGVARSRDLLVRATSTPSNSVEVLPGSYVVTNINAAYQSYSGRNVGAELVEIPASGSGGSRTWYIGVELDDGDYSGNTLVSAEQVDTFEYAKFAVRGSLTATKKTFLPLAKIVVPANTATITNSMITSLREMSNPREKNLVLPRPNVTGDTGLELKSKSAYPDGEWFPNSASGQGDGVYRVKVPEWATKAQVRCEWLGIYYKSNPGYGYYWMSYGDDAGTNNPSSYTQAFKWDSGDGNTRMNWIMEQEINIPSKWRGQELPFVPRANKTSTSAYTGTVGLSAASGMVFKIRFLEEPDEVF